MEAYFCRGSCCTKNHLPNQLYCGECLNYSSDFKCEKCDNLCIGKSLYCEDHQKIQQDILEQDIKSILSGMSRHQIELEKEISSFKDILLKMSDHFDIIVSRLDLLEHQ